VKSHQSIFGTLKGADHSAVGTEAPQPRRTDDGRPAQGKAHYRFISEWGPRKVKTDTNPGGLPHFVFDGLRGGIAGNRELFYKDVAVPFLATTRRAQRFPSVLRSNSGDVACSLRRSALQQRRILLWSARNLRSDGCLLAPRVGRRQISPQQRRVELLFPARHY
jgi:hypothetical protein